MDLPAGALASLAKRMQEEASVVIIQKDLPAGIATRHDVVVGAGVLGADAAWHRCLVRTGRAAVKICCLTPSPAHLIRMLLGGVAYGDEKKHGCQHLLPDPFPHTSSIALQTDSSYFTYAELSMLIRGA